MSDPIPVNLSSIMARQARQESKQITARQVMNEDSLEEGLETGFNPAAAEREQSRMGRFKRLENRAKLSEQAEQKIQAVDKKAEEDLAQRFSRRNPELPPDVLRNLKNRLSQSKTPEEILDEVNSTFKDATLVDEALEYFEQTSEGTLKEHIQQARELHHAQKEREIIAGRNVDAAAKAYHKQGIGQSPTELRELYRDITGNPRDPNTLFSELTKLYTYDQLKLVVAFLLKGMAYDHKSKGPSIQTAELMRLMTETRNLQSILWVFLYFKSRFNPLKNQFAKKGLPLPKHLTFELLAKAFMKFVEERYPNSLKLLKLAEQLGLLEDMEKVLVLSQYRDGIRQLSPRLYHSLRHRQDLLLVIYDTLLELEEEEEEES